MQEKVFAYLRQWNMVKPGDTVLVGFSGGADSTALLQLLWNYGKRIPLQLEAVHVNHGIRGAEALRDQQFCEQFCQERNISFTVVQEDVPAQAARDGLSLEEAGRNARRRVFEHLAEKCQASVIALAHHQRDQAETMLFRLMRGTGLRGLCGMRPVNGNYIRPLLCVDRPQIEQYLLEEGIRWVEDGTNQELDYTRNQIRHGLLAPMEQVMPGCVARMAGTAARLSEVESYLEQELHKAEEQYLQMEKDCIRIRLEAFDELHPAMQKMLVRRALEHLPGGLRDVEAFHVEQICLLAYGKRGSRILLPWKNTSVLEYDGIVLKQGYGINRDDGIIFCGRTGTYEFQGTRYEVTVENRDKNQEIPVNCYTKWFDYDKIRQEVVLRTRRPGDYLSTGPGAHKKLKDYLIDNKVPRESRDGLTVLADGNHILWVVGMRISEEYKITEQTKIVLKIQQIRDGGIKDGETSY